MNCQKFSSACEFNGFQNFAEPEPNLKAFWDSIDYFACFIKFCLSSDLEIAKFTVTFVL